LIPIIGSLLTLIHTEHKNSSSFVAKFFVRLPFGSTLPASFRSSRLCWHGSVHVLGPLKNGDKKNIVSANTFNNDFLNDTSKGTIISMPYIWREVVKLLLG